MSVCVCTRARGLLIRMYVRGHACVSGRILSLFVSNVIQLYGLILEPEFQIIYASVLCIFITHSPPHTKHEQQILLTITLSPIKRPLFMHNPTSTLFGEGAMLPIIC